MFEPLVNASLQIQIHGAGALLSIGLGPLVLFKYRRDRLHKTLGCIWVIAMAVTILSSFFILDLRMIGPFSPIHLLSVLAAVGLFSAVRFAIRRQIADHQKTMRNLYFWALGVASVLAFMPGRIMNRILFADHGLAGFVALLAVTAAVILIFRTRRHLQRVGRVSRSA